MIGRLPLALGLAAAFGGGCSGTPEDSGAPGDSVDPRDTGETGVDPGNVDWRAIGSGDWSSSENGACDEVVAAVVASADGVEPWFESVRYSASDGGGTPASVSDAVDWSGEAVVLASIECWNTLKVLSVTAMNEADGTLHVDLHLLHPGLDHGIETTYWTAAALPAALAASTLTYTLTEEEAPPPD